MGGSANYPPILLPSYSLIIDCNCSVAHVSPQYSKISQFPMLLGGTVKLSSFLINRRRKDFWKTHLKGNDGCLFASLLPLFLPDGGDVGAIAGASATILHHEVIMRVATVGRREAKQREPYHCVSPQLPSARLKKHPPVFGFPIPVVKNSSSPR